MYTVRQADLTIVLSDLCKPYSLIVKGDFDESTESRATKAQLGRSFLLLLLAGLSPASAMSSLKQCHTVQPARPSPP